VDQVAAIHGGPHGTLQTHFIYSTSPQLLGLEQSLKLNLLSTNIQSHCFYTLIHTTNFTS
jgi:hypothetical protein